MEILETSWKIDNSGFFSSRRKLQIEIQDSGNITIKEVVRNVFENLLSKAFSYLKINLEIYLNSSKTVNRFDISDQVREKFDKIEEIEANHLSAIINFPTSSQESVSDLIFRIHQNIKKLFSLSPSISQTVVPSSSATSKRSSESPREKDHTLTTSHAEADIDAEETAVPSDLESKMDDFQNSDEHASNAPEKREAIQAQPLKKTTFLECQEKVDLPTPSKEVEKAKSPQTTQVEKKGSQKAFSSTLAKCAFVGLCMIPFALLYSRPASVPAPSDSIQIRKNLNREGAPSIPSITLLTAYDEGIREYAEFVLPNQREFAAKHKYNYIEYFGNVAKGERFSRAPYWSKIVAINDQLQKTSEGEWITWLDASVLFTNTEKNFRQVIEQHGSDKDIIVTTDPQVPINNAVFLLRNTPWTREWIKKIWARADLSRGGEGNCWSWGQPFCHYEQQAMTELWESNPEVQEHTALIPNKIMNSFYRYSHYDTHRNLYQQYDGDPESSKWMPGDFICKVTGMDKVRRLAIIQHVAKNCIDQSCQKIEF